MMVQTKLAAFFALFAALTPGLLAAQQPAAAQSAPSQQQVEQWVTELQQLHVKLEAIQAEAIQDPQLQAAQESLGTEIKEAMEKVDPTLAKSLERVQAIELEARQAQEAGNDAKLQQLAQEAQGIQTRFTEAQSRVFQQPQMAAKIDAFQNRLENKMVEVDPEAAGLIERFRELELKLASAMQAAQ